MTSIDNGLVSTRCISEFGGRLLPQKSISSFGSSGSAWHSGGAAIGGGFGGGGFGSCGFRTRSGYGYSGLGLGGGLQSQAGLALGSSARGGGRFASGLAVGGGRLGLGLGMASGGAGAGGGVGGGAGSGAGFWAGAISVGDGGSQVFINNEKFELQTLNDRLATYLNKVKRLEMANQELEEKLRGFQANKVQVTYDMTAYQAQIQPIRDQLTTILSDCSRIALTIDNARLAADDFRMKFEHELANRQLLQGDIDALKVLKRDYELASATFTQEFDILSKDRAALDKAHQTEVQTLRGQMAGTLTVDIQAVESVDLSNRLLELRSEYETIVEKNHREIENWYSKKLTTKEQEIKVATDTTVSGSAEVSTSHAQILDLEAELDSLLLQKAHQEQRLVDIQSQSQVQMLTLRSVVGSLEGELVSVRESALQQAQEYQMLLSAKVQLEKEIATYKALLEGFGERWTSSSPLTTTISKSASLAVAEAGAGAGAAASAQASAGANASASSGAAAGAADVSAGAGVSGSQSAAGSVTGEVEKSP